MIVLDAFEQFVIPNDKLAGEIVAHNVHAGTGPGDESEIVDRIGEVAGYGGRGNTLGDDRAFLAPRMVRPPTRR